MNQHARVWEVKTMLALFHIYFEKHPGIPSLSYPKSYYLPYLSVCYALSMIRRSTESEVTYALMKLNIETKQASKLWG